MNLPDDRTNSLTRRVVFELRSDRSLLRLNLIALAVILAMCLVTGGKFLSFANFESMGFMLPELALLSLAMALSMMTGGIDLSVVAIANMAGIVAAMLLTKGLPVDADSSTTVFFVVMAAAAAISTGAICGAINGLLIAVFEIPAILATLGTMQLFTGLALVITDGRALSGMPSIVQIFGNGTWWGVPIPFLFFSIIAIALWVLTARTPFGLRLRLTGSNPVAAVFSAIRVRSILFRTYLFTGLLASATGLLIIARTNSAKADYGSSYLLQAILVAVLGGVNPAGGFGKVSGVIIAAFALQFLASGFNMLHYSNFVKEFVWGVFLLATIVFNFYATRNNSK